MPKSRHDAIGDDRRQVGRHARQRIEADRPLDVGGVDVDEIVRAPARDVVERRAGEVAVWVEQGDARASRKILAQQVEQQCALAGAGLTDEVKMPAALVGRERDKLARDASAEGEPMWGRIHSRKRAGVPCASQWGIDAGSAFVPEGAPGLHGVARHCAFVTRLPSPPLTVGSFPTTIRGDGGHY